MKKFTALSMIVFMLSALIPATAFAADDNVIDGATANMEYVYCDGSSTYDRSDEAAEEDGDELEVFPWEDDDQYLYLGMNTIFDKIYFDVNDDATYDDNDDVDLTWQYKSDSDGWKTLDLEQDTLDSFLDTGVNYVSFELPDDWEEYEFEGDDAYWVRVSPDEDVLVGAEIDQISARAYTVKLEIEDEDGDEVKYLTGSDFELDNGDDNELYGLETFEDGEYWLAVQTEEDDVNYELTIDDSKYDKYELTVRASTNVTTYDVELDYENSWDRDDDDDDDTPFVDIRWHWCEDAVENLYERGVVTGKSYYYYRPGEYMTRAEFLKVALLSAEVDVEDYEDEDHPYDDVHSSDWFYEYVVAAYELDVISYKHDFGPHDYINRAEAVKILVKLADVSTSWYSDYFEDVKSTDWYARYVNTAYRYGVVHGYDDDTFRPEEYVTRGGAAVMADNAYEVWYD
jgi:hypothetical protein